MCLQPKIGINPQVFKFAPVDGYFVFNGVRQDVSFPISRGYIFRSSEIFRRLRFNDAQVCISSEQDISEFLAANYFYCGNMVVRCFIIYPCGHCAVCLNDKRHELEKRALFEASERPTMYFFTLTYDDDHLPWYGVCKKHVSDAIKRLRRQLDLWFSAANYLHNRGLSNFYLEINVCGFG